VPDSAFTQVPPSEESSDQEDCRINSSARETVVPDSAFTQVPPLEESLDQEDCGINSTRFPGLLFEVLSDPRFAEILCWLPDGEKFVVRDLQNFETVVLSEIWDTITVESFRKQLTRCSFSSKKSKKKNTLTARHD
jgi:hypothetical protein